MGKFSWIFFLLVLCCLGFTVKSENQQVTKYDPQRHEYSSPKKNLAAGAIVGATRNSVNYAIHSGGRSSNILHVIDKTTKSKATWFARIDMPHKNFKSYHINVNKAITGVRDPHIRISGVTAHAAGVTGQALNVVNKVAPWVMAASVAIDAVDVINDWNGGKKSEAKRKVVSIAATNAGGYYGAGAGAVYGSMIFPGVGTVIGGIVGGLFGGFAGGIGGDVANEILQL